MRQMEEVSVQRRRRMSAAARVRAHVTAAPGALVTAGEIPGVSIPAASRALSRLAASGAIVRARKGVYYVPRDTLLGPSRPAAARLTERILEGRARPTGTTAAHLLGLTTQMPAQPEYAAYVIAPPRGATAGRMALRPRARRHSLPPADAALLEVLRDGGRHSELSPEQAISRLGDFLKSDLPGRMPLKRLRALREAGLNEPPRVRALLGALMHYRGLPEHLWRPLRDSLNPLSRFSFGIFASLPNASEWQAR
jgi:hypothetical protein